MKLLFQGLQADAVLLVGPELGDVETGSMRHVDHIGVGQNHKLILLEERTEDRVRNTKTASLTHTAGREDRVRNTKTASLTHTAGREDRGQS